MKKKSKNYNYNYNKIYKSFHPHAAAVRKFALNFVDSCMN